MPHHIRLSGPLTTSHVNKHLRYRLSKLGYAWLFVITCCIVTLVLQIISMSTQEHLLGDAGASMDINGIVFKGTIRRTYSIFHSCTAPPLSDTSLTAVDIPNACSNPSSMCSSTGDRIRVIQACSVIALFFTAVTFIMLLVIVTSPSLRAKIPLLITMIAMISCAFGFRLTLWSLILDFITNKSLCNNAYPIVPDVYEPRLGPSFIVEVISWIFLLFLLIKLLLVLGLEKGWLSFKLRSPSSSSSSSSSSSDDEKVPVHSTHPTYESGEVVRENTITEEF